MSYFDVLMRIAVTVKRFKMFPVFEIAHYILTCASVKEFTLSIHRNTLSKDSQVIFSRAHPFASWFSCLISAFAGNFLGNFLLGEPLITPLQNTRAIIYFSIVWYLINYCPFDVFSKICAFVPIKAALHLLREIRRANGVDKGIEFALMVVPDSHIIPLVFGVLKGTASNHMKVFQRLMCGVWQPSSIEVLNPSIVTKSCLIGGTILLLSKTDYLELPLPEPLLHLLIVVIFLLTHILFYFGIDPFVPAENLVGCLLTGGIMDSFRRALKPSGSVPVSGQSHATGKHADTLAQSVSAVAVKDDSGAAKGQAKSKKDD